MITLSRNSISNAEQITSNFIVFALDCISSKFSSYFRLFVFFCLSLMRKVEVFVGFRVSVFLSVWELDYLLKRVNEFLQGQVLGMNPHYTHGSISN